MNLIGWMLYKIISKMEYKMYNVIKEFNGETKTIDFATSKEEAEYILAELILLDSEANYFIEVKTI